VVTLHERFDIVKGVRGSKLFLSNDLVSDQLLIMRVDQCYYELLVLYLGQAFVISGVDLHQGVLNK
jgi:hypothetical protein